MMLPRHHSRRIFATSALATCIWLCRSSRTRFKIPASGGDSMFLAPLAAAALVVSVATAPNANPRALPTLSGHQKSAAMQSTTECIARTVSADPRLGQRNADLGDLIVDSMPHCAAQVRAMIEAYDRYFGEGEGEAFFMGPYL